MKPAGIQQTVERVVAVAALVLVALGPLIFSTYWVSFVLTQVFLLGIAAASLIFLLLAVGWSRWRRCPSTASPASSWGTSSRPGSRKELNLGWNPWLGVLLGIVIATAIAFVFGALASRSTGIYFLMITLTFAVIANLFFGQVTTFSGFGGISGIGTPEFIGNVASNPNRLYYAALVTALIVYVTIRYVVRSPFGVALQGVRDETGADGDHSATTCRSIA